MVCAAYDFIRGNKAQATLEDLASKYDSCVNPEVVYMVKSQQQVLDEFLASWDSQSRDAEISLAEFVDYYKDVSPTIQGDRVFENMVRNTWRF